MHSLVDHVRSTAALAGGFAESFGAGELAWALGLVHDAGKARCSWQDRLIAVGTSGASIGIPHKELGASFIGKRAGVAALAVLGHHGGLSSARDLKRLVPEADAGEVLERFFGVVPEARALGEGASLAPAGWGRDPLVWEMGVRMVFSALVDADYLDTAAHFDGSGRPRVADPVDMTVLWNRYERSRTAKLASAKPSVVNEVRSRLYDRVVGMAEGERGVYRLPAPTGSGKTFTAGGFAVRHAARHGMARVVVAVPFTTITQQNAQVYRELLGEDVVLEHHSNTELDTRGLRLAAENWDAPFVVTTTVQLFDSLFGRKPARSRKLHRLANAVIVLDEVQALPVSLLVPILDGLRLLVRHFGATVLLASATQPTFERLAVWESLGIKELVEDPVELSASLRRVRYEWRLDPKPATAQIAAEVAGMPQALVVVNTVKQARAMVKAVRENNPAAPVFHLSTRMVPAHRRKVLDDVDRLLGEAKPVLVISTQLVEAGVDLDFPVVFRALAPAESLQQAAGRANREGRHSELGRVVVFDAADAPAPAFYRAGIDKTLAFFGPGKADPDDSAVLNAYYGSLYAALEVDNGPRAKAIQGNRRTLDYQAVADGPVTDTGTRDNKRRRDSGLAFRMIDEDQVAVVVTGYGDTGEVREALRRIRAGEGPLRREFRVLRAYTVSLPRSVATAPAVAALFRPVVAGQRDLWEWVGDYDEQVGIDEGEIGKETVW
ncbi:CRISPR-associated helicase, Cas3 family [Actinokineospora terrae]|uniref:CRISPR-associated helicase, Cas3 family n=1 Tax=Actinokineospora terrae TaxID=155974 RepID=A0A1H9WRJ5_9PSEU|nr:CRISPR-associated helicase, Cas3 family [Actinokineospora terrae]